LANLMKVLIPNPSRGNHRQVSPPVRDDMAGHSQISIFWPGLFVRDILAPSGQRGMVLA